MGEVVPIPSLGDVFADVRGEDRTLRVSFHADRGVVVISLWAGPVCRGSFRLAASDIERLQARLEEMRTVAYWAPPVGEAPAGQEPSSTTPDAATATPDATPATTATPSATPAATTATAEASDAAGELSAPGQSGVANTVGLRRPPEPQVA